MCAMQCSSINGFTYNATVGLGACAYASVAWQAGSKVALHRACCVLCCCMRAEKGRYGSIICAAQKHLNNARVGNEVHREVREVPKPSAG